MSSTCLNLHMLDSSNPSFLYKYQILPKVGIWPICRLISSVHVCMYRTYQCHVFISYMYCVYFLYMSVFMSYMYCVYVLYISVFMSYICLCLCPICPVFMSYMSCVYVLYVLFLCPICNRVYVLYVLCLYLICPVFMSNMYLCLCPIYICVYVLYIYLCLCPIYICVYVLYIYICVYVLYVLCLCLICPVFMSYMSYVYVLYVLCLCPICTCSNWCTSDNLSPSFFCTYHRSPFQQSHGYLSFSF